MGLIYRFLESVVWEVMEEMQTIVGWAEAVQTALQAEPQSLLEVAKEATAKEEDVAAEAEQEVKEVAFLVAPEAVAEIMIPAEIQPIIMAEAQAEQ